MFFYVLLLFFPNKIKISLKSVFCTMPSSCVVSGQKEVPAPVINAPQHAVHILPFFFVSEPIREKNIRFASLEVHAI